MLFTDPQGDEIFWVVKEGKSTDAKWVAKPTEGSNEFLTSSTSLAKSLVRLDHEKTGLIFSENNKVWPL